MKKIGLLFLVLIVAAAAVVYYFWQEATTLPDWYKDASTDLRSGQTIRSSIKAFESKVQNEVRTDGSVQVTLSEEELNDAFVAGLAQKLGGDKALDLIKGSKTEIREDRISTGIVVNLSGIPLDQLDRSTQIAVDKLLNSFAFLKDSDVFVSVEGKPVVADGNLKLDDSYTIRLGSLEFTPSELAGKLGIDRKQLDQSISLDFGNMKVDEIRLGGKSATLKGSAKQGGSK